MSSAPDDLLARYFADAIDDCAVAELSAWIAAHPDHARRFAVEAMIHTQAGEHFRVASSLNAALSPWRRPRSWAMAAAAALAIVMTTSFVRVETRPTPARVAADVKAVWAVRDHSFRGVQRLSAGAAKLVFRSGATAIVQAPASFTVAQDRLDVHDGRVVVTCPTPASRALVVRAGDSSIVDLGTQFGVNVTATGAVRLRVFDGAVEVRRRAIATVVRAGQTLGFGTSPVPADTQAWLTPAAFDLSQQAAAGGASGRWATYRLALLADPMLALATHAETDERQVANLASATPLRSDAPPTFTANRFGRPAALRMGVSDVAPAGVLGGTFDAITLSAWVKLDAPQAMPDWHRGLLMTDGWHRTGQVHWQCKNDGLRISFFDGGDELDTRFAARPQGLADGGWHLLTTTVSRSPRTHVTHYLDGERAFDRTLGTVIPPMRVDAFRVGGWQDGMSSGLQRPLYGAIDDLLVFGRVLTPEEVKRLYESSRP